jgi:hypothetical protein
MSIDLANVARRLPLKRMVGLALNSADRQCGATIFTIRQITCCGICMIAMTPRGLWSRWILVIFLSEDWADMVKQPAPAK